MMGASEKGVGGVRSREQSPVAASEGVRTAAQSYA